MLDFDTGSSETWVSPPCTPLSTVPIFEEICREFGQYLPEHSQTGFKVNPDICPNHWISYGSGAVYVSYYRDMIRVNGRFWSSIGRRGLLTMPKTPRAPLKCQW